MVFIFNSFISLIQPQNIVTTNDNNNMTNVLIVVSDIESDLFNLEEYDAKTEVSPENIEEDTAYIIHIFIHLIIFWAIS